SAPNDARHKPGDPEMFSFLTPWVKRLIAANVLVFAAQYMLPWITDAFAFAPSVMFSRPCTLFTYMFLPCGISPLVFHMVTLGFFGPKVELQLGGKRFLTLYFVSGLSGALLSFFTSPYGIVGASGAIFGVQLAYATFWPRDRFYIWGVLPLEARWVVI